MRRYFGAIAFLDSTREDRRTLACDFRVISDWLSSVEDYYRNCVAVGDYDGTEILVNVYECEYDNPSDFDYDTDKLVATVSIKNPYMF